MIGKYMAIDCLLWLLQDPSTCHKVIDKTAPALVDLAEITTLGDHKKLGDSIVNVLQESWLLLAMLHVHLCLHNPLNRHAKVSGEELRLMTCLGCAKESLLDAILFINECSQSNDPDLSLRQNKVPDYA
ncbi:hypothetical protein M0R45_017124 [Rubus argutus]|uniref:Uncharacterized protein n=1 Tax=Rubus argutus TaxID=59490 RepID=A0AAW1XUN2_RUBAR